MHLKLAMILYIMYLYNQIKDNPNVEAVFKGIRPAVVALIAMPVFSMAKSAKLNRYNFWIPVLSTVLIWALGVSPVWVIVYAGIGGFLYGRYLKREEDKTTNS